MAAPGFYNEQDQNIYDNVSKFMPQSKYLRSAPTFTAPTTEEEITETFGIPNTNAFTNSGGDNYTGGYNFNNNGFQQAVDARQNRLNNPSDTFLGFNTMKDQEQTMMGKVQSFLTPQSAQSILEDGYREPRFQPGIIGTIMGKLDNYRNLPQVDQAFIAKNMGYTGPTVFGDNNSGLGKDPFGLNTRSMFGNYAERVGVEAEKLGDALSATGAIGGKSAYQGATFNPATGKFEADDDNEASIAAAMKANQMTKMVRQKYGFYTKQNQDYADIINKKAELQGIQDTKVAQNFALSNPNYGDAGANINPGSGGGSGYDPQADYSGSDKRSQDNRSSDLGFSDIRLKENVELIGKSPSNINIYKFNYKDSPTTYQGAMAHEVLWASQKHNNGYLMVDYNKIDVNFKKI